MPEREPKALHMLGGPPRAAAPRTRHKRSARKLIKTFVCYEHSCDYLCYTSNCRANGGAAAFASKRPSMRNRLTTPSRSSSNCIAVFAKRASALESCAQLSHSLATQPRSNNSHSEAHPRYCEALASMPLANSQLLQNCIHLDTLEEEFMEVVPSKNFKKWLLKLRDAEAKNLISFRIQTIARLGTLVGDWKSIEGKIFELRFHRGPGYRVYGAIEKDTFLILAAGGTKATQSRDIALAKKLMREWEDEQNV